MVHTGDMLVELPIAVVSIVVIVLIRNRRGNNITIGSSPTFSLIATTCVVLALILIRVLDRPVIVTEKALRRCEPLRLLLLLTGLFLRRTV